MKVLLIEDDSAVSSFLKRGLEEEEFNVDLVENGEDAIKAAKNKYDVIILDWMLPDKDGIEVLQEIRKEGNNTPVLMLTAKDTTENKIEGLEKGADDYMSKPFEFEELLARLKALYRRSNSDYSDKIAL